MSAGSGLALDEPRLASRALPGAPTTVTVGTGGGSTGHPDAGRANAGRAAPPAVPRTLPQHLARHAALRGGEPALRHKSRGRWETWTWQQLGEEVELFAAGLARLGFGPGEVLALLGDTDPRQLVAVLATQRRGGAVVPLDPRLRSAEQSAVLTAAAVRFAYAAEDTDVVCLLGLPADEDPLTVIICGEGRGLRGHGDARLLPYEAIAAPGSRSVAASGRDIVGDKIDDDHDDAAAGRRAFGFWSVDESGRAHGAWIEQGELLTAARESVDGTTVSRTDEAIAQRSLSWRPNTLTFAQWQLIGFRLSCPESGGNPELDRRQVAPTYLFAPSAFYLELWRDVSTRLPAAGSWQRRLIDAVFRRATRAQDRRRRGHRIGFGERLLLGLGRALVTRPLSAILGLGRVRLAVAVGQPLGDAEHALLSALGIPTRHLAASPSSPYSIRAPAEERP